MRALFEVVLIVGTGGAAIAYIVFIRNKFRTRGYRIQFVGGPIDGDAKQVSHLTPTFTVNAGTDHRGNRLVATYELDDLNVGVYTFVREEVLSKTERQII